MVYLPLPYPSTSFNSFSQLLPAFHSRRTRTKSERSREELGNSKFVPSASFRPQIFHSLILMKAKSVRRDLDGMFFEIPSLCLPSSAPTFVDLVRDASHFPLNPAFSQSPHCFGLSRYRESQGFKPPDLSGAQASTQRFFFC